MGIEGLICGIISYRLVRRNEKGVPAPLPIFYCAGFTWEVIKMKICKIEECENKHFGKGYCKEHFYKSDYFKAIQQRRRAKLNNCQINDFKSSDWAIILDEFEWRCAYCGEESGTLHQEHVNPIHHGGNNTISNIVPSCPRCNRSKGTKDVADWYKEQPFYDKEKFDAIIKHTKEKNLV